MNTPSPDLDHVARPNLPWREETLTECGLPPAPDRRIIDRETFHSKLIREGKQRSAITTCMTCWHTAQRWEDWHVNPADVLRRELRVNLSSSPRLDRLSAELRAIAALVAAHRDEFEGYLAGLQQTADLNLVRQARRRRVVRRQGIL